MDPSARSIIGFDGHSMSFKYILNHFDGFDGHPHRMVAPNGCGDADRTVSNHGAGHPG